MILGHFKNDTFHGDVQWFFIDGAKSRCIYVNGKQNGPSVKTYPEGKVETIYFDMGRRVKNPN